MHYVVYEDDPTSRARVHKASCSRYENRKASTLPNNRWHEGPYSRSAAFAKMDSLGKSDSGPCGTCNP